MKKCGVCELSESKYRCPKCRVLYCSVGCYKSHKDNCDKLQQQKEEILPEKRATVTTNNNHVLEPGELPESESDDEDKVGHERLSSLENSQELKNLLENKHLRRIIKEIDENDDPGSEVEAAMKLPIFVEFANECLKSVQEER